MVRQRKTQNSDVEKQRLNKVIHVSVRSSSSISRTNAKHHQNRGGSVKVSTDKNPTDYEKQSINSVTVTKVHRLDGFPAKITKSLANDQNSSLWNGSKLGNHSLKSFKVSLSKSNQINASDRYDMTEDYHRKGKKRQATKCSRQCITISSIALVLLLLIIAAIVLPLVLKSKSRTRTIPTTVPMLRWNSTGITVAGISGSPGNASNQLDTPIDVVFDYANNLYIADYLNHRVQKYLLGTSIGHTVAGTGNVGSSPSQLNKPIRVVLDSNENLYISDANNHRVQFWFRGATNGTTVAGISNSPGNSSNQFNFPYGLVLHPTSGTLYIADYYNHRVMSYTSGSNSGTLIFGGHGGGTSNAQLYFPIGLHLNPLINSLVVANYGANNVVQFTLGGSNWTIAAGNASGFSGVSSTDLSRPIEATFDPMGNMYVADRNNHRIQFFHTEQWNGTTIAGITGVNDSALTTLSWPRSVRLDSQLNLYVADSNNHRIQKFLRY